MGPLPAKRHMKKSHRNALFCRKQIQALGRCGKKTQGRLFNYKMKILALGPAAAGQDPEAKIFIL